jgi:hypothetical protein
VTRPAVRPGTPPQPKDKDAAELARERFAAAVADIAPVLSATQRRLIGEAAEDLWARLVEAYARGPYPPKPAARRETA